MKTIFQIAWKNIWRNKLRSSIVLLAIIIGLVGGIFYLAFANGLIQTLIKSSINSKLSNIQIHNPEFLINSETKQKIVNTKKILEKLKTVNNIKGISTRIITNSMISSANTGTGVVLNGIAPQEEKNVTDIYSKIIKGTYFEKKVRNSILISSKLAEKLKVKVKSKVVVTLQNLNNEITYGAFRVIGIYKTEDTNFDLLNTFVLKDDLKNLIKYNSYEAVEIAILLNHNNFTDETEIQIKKILSDEINKKEIVVRSWKEIQPVLKMMNDMTIQFAMIFVIIILVSLSFAIINTMLMAIMERVREIGMLMAIGMSKPRVFFMIMLETIFLSLTGGVIGILISWLLIHFTFKTGIDLSQFGEGLNSYGYSSFVKPELENIYYFLITLLVIVMAIFASILPVRKALKLNPSEAIRQDA
ncbi:MAG: ABC transporter permease [Ignavibacteriae bacterium]|nr:MAG: ABC transporter permease [Ignavibacteriota bacterium]